ncbi:hypothetical protein K2Y11_16685 [bacterium]|nr:hypothetical protein [bacterium]
MIVPISSKQARFYREFLMVRGKPLDPREYGIDMERDAFVDQMIDAFNDAYRGEFSIDELLLRPREALVFCDNTRRRFGYWDLPDDIILRTILNGRKSP